jgi:hypothetical protein
MSFSYLVGCVFLPLIVNPSSVLHSTNTCGLMGDKPQGHQTLMKFMGRDALWRNTRLKSTVRHGPT